MLPFIPLHFLCTHFWQLLFIIELVHEVHKNTQLKQKKEETHCTELLPIRYEYSAGNTAQENSSIFSLIRMR